MTHERIDTTAGDLRPGDSLLLLGGVGYAQLRDPESDPLLVAEVRPPLDDHDPNEAIFEILTSVGPMYARDTAPAVVSRSNTVTDNTILLISRRQSLHSRLLETGVPVVRRCPVDDDTTAHRVTAQEWVTAPLIVIDGYLAISTLTGMWGRGDLVDRDQIIMVGTDPEDVRAEARQRRAKARIFALLPHDKESLRGLFRAAAYSDRDHDPFLGILTPYAVSHP